LRAGQTEPIDRRVLGSWLGGDAAAVTLLLRKFARTARETDGEISAAVRSGKLAAAAAAAHKLNGAARSVGAIGVAEAAAVIEAAGKAGDRAACNDALGLLASELRRALTEVASER
jgi:HPt (histidine-containing phosphotransfer) domain-containing protein